MFALYHQYFLSRNVASHPEEFSPQWTHYLAVQLWPVGFSWTFFYRHQRHCVFGALTVISLVSGFQTELSVTVSVVRFMR